MFVVLELWPKKKVQCTYKKNLWACPYHDSHLRTWMQVLMNLILTDTYFSCQSRFPSTMNWTVHQGPWWKCATDCFATSVLYNILSSSSTLLACKSNLSRVSVDIPCPQIVMAGYSREAIGRAVVYVKNILTLQYKFIILPNNVVVEKQN